MIFSTFLLLLATIAYSEAATVRSAADIQEYEQFLRNSVHGEPEAPLSPGLEETGNAWERSGKFEGDIILSEKEIKQMVDAYAGKRNGLIDKAKLWPGAQLVYSINTTDFEPDQVKAIEDALAYVTTISCVTFRKKTENDKNFVYVKGGNACNSAIGYQNEGAQVLELQSADPGVGCFMKFTIIHEFLHALGFHHMQRTYNRDDYVRINMTNIKEDKQHNFDILSSDEVTLLGTEYDYGSVMHYSRTAFAIDKNIDTITPLKPLGDIVMGQQEKMTVSDIQRLNRLYECKQKKTKSKKPSV